VRILTANDSGSTKREKLPRHFEPQASYRGGDALGDVSTKQQRERSCSRRLEPQMGAR